MRHLLLFVFFTLSAFAQPNLVLLLADDHSAADMSVYGAQDIPTPHLDRMAAAGMVFERAFVNSPSCAPSRAALFTGLYPAKNGAEANHAKVHAHLKRLPACLKALGYETVSFGKTSHYSHVTEQGFDRAENYGYHDHAGVQACIDWLKRRKSQKPLALVFGTNWPHVPLPPPESVEPAKVRVRAMHVDTPEFRHYRARYINAVMKMDEEIGAVYEAAKKHLGAENTFFLQTSDHGAQLPFGKWNLYDEGTRVPLIVQWQGKVAAGARTMALAQWIDILPTLIEAGGGVPPADLDGMSLLPVLTGKSSTHREAIFTTHTGDNNMNVYPSRSMRTARWKYIRNLHPEFRFTSHIDRSANEDSLAYIASWEKAAQTDPRAAFIVKRYRERPAEELYDLEADPCELNNLAAENKAQLDEMRRGLDGWMNGTGDTKQVAGKPLLLTDKFELIHPPRAKRADESKRNVLLILVDDLKPALGCYGDTAAKTPHMDRLAAWGMRFDLAYCNQAVCAPSRFTLMLGSRSTSTGLYGLHSQLRKILPEAVTMPQFFARHGWHTQSLGKVFHVGHGNEGDPQSFTTPPLKDKVIEYLDPASTQGGQLTREEALFTNQRLDAIRSLPRGAAWEAPDAEDEDYADGRVAAEAVKRLREAKRPFFIAAGFVRPHLPFCAPRRYWEMHDPRKLPMPVFGNLPAGSPKVAHKRGGEIVAYALDEPFSTETKQELIHGYYASTSYVDAQIGKVLAELERLDLAKNTIVVLWGDHGFHLGDLGIWTKHTNYEQANRIPLMIVAPGVTRPGSSTRQLAESVDVFPTLAELAGLPAPRGPQPMDGTSLVPVLRDPQARVRDHACHCYPKEKMGRAIRTERHRLVEWKKPGAAPETAELELYDYEADPHETRNLAAEQPDAVKRLRAILDRHPEALP